MIVREAHREGEFLVFNKVNRQNGLVGCRQSVLSLAGSGFGPPSEISYRGLKLSRVPAAFGRFQLRRLTDLPQVAQRPGGLPPVIRPA